ncbi:lytic murein transglycosylase [Rhodoligotrophos defluvii]|uniref:lytic murein transglycosylase n=1 Tax=Rhodoligotrophos defluvii TaxID=2561934 RepID=UPI0010CA07CD|nr:lytic murein transglycosylase [Rhodoligotrophos defluvii]
MRGVFHTLSALLAGFIVVCSPFVLSAQAQAVQCEPAGGFQAWVKSFKAAHSNLSPRTLAALDGATLDQQVLRLDRNQRHFKQSFEQFSRSRITAGRLNKGRSMLKRHAALLKRIEQRFGVPPEVVVAIWGLETDYGVNMGKQQAIRSLATLAYDCRRTDMFQRELLAALQIIERGDLRPSEMRGAWAGELGQTQFLPSSYLRFAVDFDGNGRRDLIRSVPDVLASTANYLKGYGWSPGAGWGPGQPNFAALKGWNKADVYARTIALFAEKLSTSQSSSREPAGVPTQRDRQVTTTTKSSPCQRSC